MTVLSGFHYEKVTPLVAVWALLVSLIVITSNEARVYIISALTQTVLQMARPQPHRPRHSKLQILPIGATKKQEARSKVG